MPLLKAFGSIDRSWIRPVKRRPRLNGCSACGSPRSRNSPKLRLQAASGQSACAVHERPFDPRGGTWLVDRASMRCGRDRRRFGMRRELHRGRHRMARMGLTAVGNSRASVVVKANARQGSIGSRNPNDSSPTDHCLARKVQCVPERTEAAKAHADLHACTPSRGPIWT